MKEQPIYVIDEILHNESYTFDSLYSHLKNNPDDIHELKKALTLDAQKEYHNLIIKYIQKLPLENRKELFEEICKIYKGIFQPEASPRTKIFKN